jgi:hypothetical protein
MSAIGTPKKKVVLIYECEHLFWQFWATRLTRRVARGDFTPRPSRNSITLSVLDTIWFSVKPGVWYLLYGRFRIELFTFLRAIWVPKKD